jgi:hypothetical protein
MEIRELLEEMGFILSKGLPSVLFEDTKPELGVEAINQLAD